MPFWSVMGGFVAGILGRLVLNPILYSMGYLQRWQPGMDYIQTSVANQFDFWLSFTIGTALAVAAIGFYEAGRGMLKARREGKNLSISVSVMAPPKGRGDIPITIALLFYVAQTVWTIMLAHWLVPKFPVWIMVAFGFGYTPLMSYISARLIGLTGSGVGIPYAKEATFVLSRYKGVDIWSAPIPMGDWGSASQSFREIELTGTKFTSIFKAQLFVIPVSLFVSLFFWSFIYKMSDIPEDYPTAMRFWPMNAVLTCFWWTATTSGNSFFLQAFKPEFIGWGLGYGLVLYPIMKLIGAPTLFLYGTIMGLVSDPMNMIPMFVAAMLGRFYMAKVFGEKQWANYTPVLAAGFSCGIGLIGMLSMGFSLISSAVSLLPF